MSACRIGSLFVSLALIFTILYSLSLQTFKNCDKFNSFLVKYQKNYSEEEYLRRCELFMNSLKLINELNANRTSEDDALYGITKYADLTAEEFISAKRLGNNFHPIKATKTKLKRQIPEITLPQTMDWRVEGKITPVNDQGECGACWAFATIETIESSLAIMRQLNATALSTQQMLACAGNGNHGCAGGNICTLLTWLTANRVGIRSAREIPFTGNNATCALQMADANGGVHVDSFICRSFADDEMELLATLAFLGPVAAGVNAIGWQHYLGGVIQYHCAEAPALQNHAVQIVGYSLAPPTPYYIVRNSWGSAFGDGGYLRIAIGRNLCGIANQVAAVRVKQARGG